MKKLAVVLAVICLFLFPSAALAFSLNLGKITDWLGWEAVAYITTGILSLGGIGGSVILWRVIATLREGGQAVVIIAEALADRTITTEELKDILVQVKDVFSVWKATPDMFKVK